MRLVEIVAALFLCVVFLEIWISGFIPVQKIYKDFCQKSAAYERDRFISESFKKLCMEEKKLPEEFDDWISMCSSLWNVDGLTVNVIDKKNSSVLFECSWKSEKEKVTVVKAFTPKIEK